MATFEVMQAVRTLAGAPGVIQVGVVLYDPKRDGVESLWAKEIDGLEPHLESALAEGRVPFALVARHTPDGIEPGPEGDCNLVSGLLDEYEPNQKLRAALDAYLPGIARSVGIIPKPNKPSRPFRVDSEAA